MIRVTTFLLNQAVRKSGTVTRAYNWTWWLRTCGAICVQHNSHKKLQRTVHKPLGQWVKLYNDLKKERHHDHSLLKYLDISE